MSLQQLAQNSAPAVAYIPSGRIGDGPGRPGVVKRDSRCPMEIYLVWRFCFLWARRELNGPTRRLLLWQAGQQMHAIRWQKWVSEAERRRLARPDEG